MGIFWPFYKGISKNYRCRLYFPTSNSQPKTESYFKWAKRVVIVYETTRWTKAKLEIKSLKKDKKKKGKKEKKNEM